MFMSFTSEAQSSDGTVRIGVVDGGYMKISTDSGLTYTTQSSAGIRAWKYPAIECRISCMDIGGMFVGWTSNRSGGGSGDD